MAQYYTNGPHTPTLLSGQKLLGEGAAFSFAVQPGNPIEIVPEISTVISGNQVSNNVGGILLRIQDAAGLSALVDANTLLDNLDDVGAPLDFEARAQDNAVMCLELTDNGNGANTASFDVRADNAATIQFFELGNAAAATITGVGVTPVAAGTCGLP